MIRYLTEEEMVAINYAVIKQISPTEDFGVKEPSALNAVVNQPKQVVFGEELYPYLYDKAAILFEKTVNKHCFYNGNKRTATMALYVFLKRNGVQLHASNKALADMAVNIAAERGHNQLKQADIVDWIKEHSHMIS